MCDSRLQSRRGLRGPGHCPGKEVNCKMAKITRIGRNAGNGRFVPVKTAESKPNTHVVETIKAPNPKK